MIPPDAVRILDVGCSRGGFGRALKVRSPGHQIWGIELDEGAAAEARIAYDEVIVGAFPDAVPSGMRFDCVVFNDVLEHMVDPWAVLRSTRHVLEDGGAVVASIPNVRYLPVLLDLGLRGDWRYTDIGPLDRSHLRFFTRKTISDLFESNGYRVDVLEPINLLGRRRKWRHVALLIPRDIRCLQYAVRASVR